jgi:hypothetical protein
MVSGFKAYTIQKKNRYILLITLFSIKQIKGEGEGRRLKGEGKM